METMTPKRLREIAADMHNRGDWEDAAELRAHAAQLERNGWQPISAAPNTKEEVLNEALDEAKEKE